jgi:ubiquinone/menaquinone biosynthesis C-methylase UbiE
MDNSNAQDRQKQISLSQAWEQEAERWAQWARKPGHDSYWQFHRDQFLPLVPVCGTQTVDVGCGEGRLCRDLKQLGHNVIGVDASETLIRLAQEADPEGTYICADAAALPLADDLADLVVAFMSLQDVDDLNQAVSEIARVLSKGGRACAAIVHPLNSAGNFAGQEPDAEFVIKGSYLDEFRYSDSLERDGLEMTFNSLHRSLECYSRAIEKAGLLIEAIREHRVPDNAVLKGSARRWQRLPLFMHIRAVKPIN